MSSPISSSALLISLSTSFRRSPSFCLLKCHHGVAHLLVNTVHPFGVIISSITSSTRSKSHYAFVHGLIGADHLVAAILAPVISS